MSAPGTGSLAVYTFKDGLLARLAHDLRLHVTRFHVSLRDGRVTASFDPASARVDGVAHGDRVDPGALSEKDKRSIEATIRTDILGAAPVSFDGVVSSVRAPGGAGAEATVPGRAVGGSSAGRVRGDLTVRGRVQEVDLAVALRAGPGGAEELVVDVEIVPTRWGIAPYRALAGAIRLQDRWRIQLVLPWDGGELVGTREWRVG